MSVTKTTHSCKNCTKPYMMFDLPSYMIHHRIEYRYMIWCPYCDCIEYHVDDGYDKTFKLYGVLL